MGGWICRGWISRFGDAPIFHPEVPKPFKSKHLGTLGAPQKARNPTMMRPTPHSRPSQKPIRNVLLQNLFRLSFSDGVGLSQDLGF